MSSLQVSIAATSCPLSLFYIPASFPMNFWLHVARMIAVLSELSEDTARVTPRAVFRPLVDHCEFCFELYLDYLGKRLSLIISKRF
jgi:hypothetical protein